MPGYAAARDTISIKFQTDAGPCDTGVIIESQMVNDGMRISASSDLPSPGPCPGAGEGAPLAIPRIFVYLVRPFHSIPFTVNFAEPGQADNVFVVKAP